MGLKIQKVHNAHCDTLNDVTEKIAAEWFDELKKETDGILSPFGNRRYGSISCVSLLLKNAHPNSGTTSRAYSSTESSSASSFLASSSALTHLRTSATGVASSTGMNSSTLTFA